MVQYQQSGSVMVAQLGGAHGDGQQHPPLHRQQPAMAHPPTIESVAMLQDYMTRVHPRDAAAAHLQSTWGDPHYVGLNGLQLLSPSGEPIALSAQQLSAEPPSVASLPQLRNDPRTVDKLVDGTNASYDDRHMFLSPFTPGRSNAVTVDLGRHGEAIAAIRLWNCANVDARRARLRGDTRRSPHL